MISNIYCIGRNYSQHAVELGNNLEAEPVVFSKPNTSLILDNHIHLPAFSNNIHYETELVIRIAQAAFAIPEDRAASYYDSVAVGLDLTARDLQTHLKTKQLPWLLAKGFKGSCYVSQFVAKERLPTEVEFGLQINHQQVQLGNSAEMIFSIPQLISFISHYIALQPGDIIFTGTPQGVGKLNSGDKLSLTLQGRKMAQLQVD